MLNFQRMDGKTRDLYNCYMKKRWYVGCNHGVALSNTADIATTRGGKSFIVGNAGEELFYLPQQTPLSVRSTPPNESAPGIITWFNNDGSNIDLLREYRRYDVIIVSQRYAMAIKNFTQDLVGCASFNAEDYLDRLYVPHPLYDAHPEEREAKKIGVAYLKKVVPAAELRDYQIAINQNLQPSLFSMVQAATAPIVSRKYPSLLNQSSVPCIMRYIDDTMQKILADTNHPESMYTI